MWGIANKEHPFGKWVTNANGQLHIYASEDKARKMCGCMNLLAALDAGPDVEPDVRYEVRPFTRSQLQ